MKKYASLLTVCVEAAVQVLLAVPELPALLLATLPLLLPPTAVVMALQPHSSLCSVCVCAVAVTTCRPRSAPAGPPPGGGAGSRRVDSDAAAAAACSWSTRTIAVPEDALSVMKEGQRRILIPIFLIHIATCSYRRF